MLIGRRNLSKEDRDELIRRLAASGHKQKEIAEAVGLSKMRINQIVNDEKSKEILHSPTIKSTSAAEEMEAKRTNADKKHAVKMAFQQLMEDGRNIRDVDDVSHTEVAKMAAVSVMTVTRHRDTIILELLGEITKLTPPTIPPKSKQTSTEDTQRLKDELASMQPVVRKRTPRFKASSMFHVKHELLTFPRMRR